MLTKFVRAMKFSDKVTLGRWRRLRILPFSVILYHNSDIKCRKWYSNLRLGAENPLQMSVNRGLLSIADFTALDAVDFASTAVSTESVFIFGTYRCFLSRCYQCCGSVPMFLSLRIWIRHNLYGSVSLH
jgi:hypothetical protein